MEKEVSAQAKNQFKIVDLFAGPGGLGEGFSSHPSFEIAVSAEMECSAHATLRLRAFYRKLKGMGQDATWPYFELCNEEKFPPNDRLGLGHWNEQTKKAWSTACGEALQLTLGEPECNSQLDDAIKLHNITPDSPWVLIGGPPCQAYSLVGRSRNKGRTDYSAENDNRHFLYKEYLRIISENRPAVFVMENVKGILSSKVGGQRIFHTILQDLAKCEYRIFSLVTDTCYQLGDNPSEVDASNFIVRAEQFGIPQARHRVILLGIREDICVAKGLDWKPSILKKEVPVSVFESIGDLPPVRSRISKGGDDEERWALLLAKHCQQLAKEAASKKHDLYHVAEVLCSVPTRVSFLRKGGSPSHSYHAPKLCPPTLRDWYTSQGAAGQLSNFLNHEPRGHMASDLKRYVYASAFAEATGRSPKGHKDFALNGLAPDHLNWKSGKFADRFRVQQNDRPSTTITSHIAKDGHYFIHYDPAQCRSLTVREAARLQTFPDDYFFQGNRTQQYQQVGNAVPPFLAAKIAVIVSEVLN